MSNLPAKYNRSLVHATDRGELVTLPGKMPDIAGLPAEEQRTILNSIRYFQEWLLCPPAKRDVAIARAAHGLKKSRRAVRDLFSAAQEEGSFERFLPRRRADAGVPRDWDGEAIEQLWDSYKRIQHVRLAYDECVDICNALGLRTGSYRQACRYIQTKSEKGGAAEVAMAFQEKEYTDLYQVPVLRDYDSMEPMDVIVGDHHQFDTVIVWNGAVVRPWVSAWIDARTRHWLGFTVCKSPDAKSIADSLYITFKYFGFPRHIYIDNGKSYRAKILKGNQWVDTLVELPDFDEDTFLRLQLLQGGMYGQSQVHYAVPFNPQSKIVERYFGIGGLSDWSKTLPGYTGRRYDDKPDRTKRAEKSGRGLLSIEDFVVELFHYMQKMNNRPTTAQGLDGNSPATVWNWYVQQRGWRPRMLSDMSMLETMLMHSKPCTVRAAGIEHSSIKGDKMYYWAPELTQYIKQKVLVKWGAADLMERKSFTIRDTSGVRTRLIPSTLYVYSMREDEQYRKICEALPRNRVQYFKDSDAVEQLRNQRKQKRAIRDGAEPQSINLIAPPNGVASIEPVLVNPSNEMESVDDAARLEEMIAKAGSQYTWKNQLNEDD